MNDLFDKILKRVLMALAWLAFAGFVVSVAVHIAACMGIRLFPGAQLLHVGVFVVLLPAVFAQFPLIAGVGLNRREMWNALLRGCPDWMRRLVLPIFIYAAINFFVFVLSTSSAGSHRNSGEWSLVELRGFSGHWLCFYYTAFAVLYSAAQVGRLEPEKCSVCGVVIGPMAQYCKACGAKVLPRTPPP